MLPPKYWGGGAGPSPSLISPPLTSALLFAPEVADTDTGISFRRQRGDTFLRLKATLRSTLSAGEHGVDDVIAGDDAR